MGEADAGTLDLARPRLASQVRDVGARRGGVIAVPLSAGGLLTKARAVSDFMPREPPLPLTS
jgi:hypothetical protein